MGRFVMDGVFYGVSDEWSSILLFPFTVASIEFLYGFGHTANVSIYAYGLFDNLLIAQLLSLFGTFSLSFLITFFATALDYTVKILYKERRFSKILLGYIIALLIIELYGGIQLRAEPSMEKVKVLMDSGPCQKYFMKGSLCIAEYDSDSTRLQKFEYQVSQKAKEAKAVGAKLLMFAEEAFEILINERDAFLAYCKKEAQQNGLYMLVSLDILESDYIHGYNANAFINDENQIVYYYTKHNPIPGVEVGYKRGKEKIKKIKTPFGDVGIAICYDLNFPYFINYIGFKHPDILLAPSWDYDEVADFQTRLAKFRAIENGFNIVKNTFGGVALVADFTGKVLYYMKSHDFFDYSTIADVYTHGRVTLYSCIGIFWNYLYILAMLGILFIKTKFDWSLYERKMNEEKPITTTTTEVKPFYETENSPIVQSQTIEMNAVKS